MNYTQAYRALVAYGFTPPAARTALDFAESTGPAEIVAENRKVSVTFAAKGGFSFEEREEK